MLNLRALSLVAFSFVTLNTGCGTPKNTDQAERNQSSFFDVKVIGDYTVYAWPETFTPRSKVELAKQMREYSRYVGTLLGRAPEDDVELLWASRTRMMQQIEMYSQSGQGPENFCNAVSKSLVEDLLPEGSKYRQLGNCGEGGLVGACLSYNAGFKTDEIMLCESKNDHFFALVKDTYANSDWCILDRWKIVNQDNWACDVRWDEESQGIFHKGKLQTDKWMQQVKCVSFETYLNSGMRVRND